MGLGPRMKGKQLNMAKSINLQDSFLNQVRKENISVTIYLTSGNALKGTVKGFDAFTVLLDAPGKATQLVYKHAIATVAPARQYGVDEPEGE
jgi:host factor-I protein